MDVQRLYSSLGSEYKVFFNHTYEMADDPSKCLVEAFEDQVEREFRRLCDHYLIDPSSNDDIFARNESTGIGWMVDNTNLNSPYIERCKAV